MSDQLDALIPPKTVLIAGVGRSGTSWLGKILDSSPYVFYKPQPDGVSRCEWSRNPSADGILPRGRWRLRRNLQEGMGTRIKVFKRLTYGLRDGT